MSLNIFQIWNNIGRTTPFAVRRDHWSEKYYTIVETVEISKMPYGIATGYPTINGVYSNHYEYNRKWKDSKIIPCAGCYQWSLVELDNIKTEIKQEEKRPQSLKKVEVYLPTSKFHFGKYKNKSLEEVRHENSGYIDWALLNVDTFCIEEATLEKLFEDSTLSSKAIETNKLKLTKNNLL